MRFLPFLVLTACLSACTSDKAPEPEEATQPLTQTNITKTKDLKPGLLSSFPDDVVESGCACSLHLEKGKDEDLFFVFDWKGNGGGKLNINDKDVVLVRGASLKTNNEKYDSYLHQNSAWTVNTSITKRGPVGEEGDVYTGSVKISNRRTGVKKEMKVTGTCSC